MTSAPEGFAKEKKLIKLKVHACAKGAQISILQMGVDTPSQPDAKAQKLQIQFENSDGNESVPGIPAIAAHIMIDADDFRKKFKDLGPLSPRLFKTDSIPIVRHNELTTLPSRSTTNNT